MSSRMTLSRISRTRSSFEDANRCSSRAAVCEPTYLGRVDPVRDEHDGAPRRKELLEFLVAGHPARIREPHLDVVKLGQTVLVFLARDGHHHEWLAHGREAKRIDLHSLARACEHLVVRRELRPIGQSLLGTDLEAEMGLGRRNVLGREEANGGQGEARTRQEPMPACGCLEQVLNQREWRSYPRAVP